jgi:hypothetical protein
MKVIEEDTKRWKDALSTRIGRVDTNEIFIPKVIYKFNVIPI